MAQPVIEMTDVCKAYHLGANKIDVLKNINLRVEKGEFVAILGPSGSGKSTLMNIIGCMDTLDTGQYLLLGAEIQKQRDKELTRIRNRHIGFVFQKYQLIPKYTARQNVIMPLIIRGMSSHRANEAAKDVIERIGLDERIEHKPSELSGGQQQRVAIARALVTNPAVLLADEPTGALDQATGAEVMELFKRLNEAGNTIIVITHDLNVAKHAKRIVHIIDGRLSEDNPEAGDEAASNETAAEAEQTREEPFATEQEASAKAGSEEGFDFIEN